MNILGEKLRAGKAEREWFRSLLDVVIECFPMAASVPWVINPRLSRALGHCKATPGGECFQISINEDFLCRCYRREVLGQPAAAWSRHGGLIDTMVHEAAHLLHFNHGAHFRLANWELNKLVKARLAGRGPAALAAALVAQAKKPASARQGELVF